MTMNPKNWRETILHEFVPDVSRLTLVADPDGLLTEEKMALALRERGFDILEFDDAIAFRYVYESKYRSIWDRGEQTDLVVILRVEDSELDELPYDLLRIGRRLSFSLPELFPSLSYPVLEGLDRSLLDQLSNAETNRQDRLGDNATRDFILATVFGLRADSIRNDVDLLRALLTVHYKDTALPQDCADRLAAVLRSSHRFDEWALAEIIGNRSCFYAFLQERWPRFIKRLGIDGIGDHDDEYGLRYAGPADLPFEHDDIRVYIDNLFADGRLVPEACNPSGDIEKSWVRCGLDAEGVNEEHVQRLFGMIEDSIPVADARHTDWQQVAARWAGLCSLVHGAGDAANQAKLRLLGKTLNQAFADWLQKHFCGLVSLPATNPTLLHHVPRKMAMEIGQNKKKKMALVVVDGFSLENWVQTKPYLRSLQDSVDVTMGTVFSWIPTVTNVARQTVFSGVPPMQFPRTIYTTNAEDRLWTQFWLDKGLQKRKIVYAKGIDQEWLDTANEQYALDQTRAIGLVIDKVDKIMHGMQLGAEGMWSQVDLWLQSGFLERCLQFLLSNGFDVCLTSDHGNVECRGIQNLDEGSIAKTRSKRVRIYPNDELRHSVHAGVERGVLWEPVGLPAGFYPLLAQEYDAFIPAGATRISHGGITLEETIVPLISFSRRQD